MSDFREPATMSKSALDSFDDNSFYSYSQQWEVPTVIALVIVAVLLLLRSYWKIQAERKKGQLLCEQSLAKIKEQ